MKELLNVSSDWKDVNNLKGSDGESGGIDCQDFQAKQIDRIVEAIALTLPANVTQNTSLGMLGLIGGNTLSTANLDSQNISGIEGPNGS